MLIVDSVDGHLAGYADVCAVPTPQQTRSYQPVHNKDLIDYVRVRVGEQFGSDIISESYALSCKDQQMFGTMTVETENPEHNLTIGLRNSYNKSLSVGLCSGSEMMVCTNLCFSGSAMTVLRKHTVNVWRDIETHVDAALMTSKAHYERMSLQLEAMKTVPLDLEDGYGLIGRALGHDVLKPQQATVAMKDWKSPRHEEFEARDMFSMYNCFTEGLKKGVAGSTIDRHAAAHRFISAYLNVPRFQGLFDDSAVVPGVQQVSRSTAADDAPDGRFVGLEFS